MEWKKADFAKQLRLARRAAGMTQHQLGEALAYSAKAVSKWESGRALPPSELLPALAQALHTDLNTLFDCHKEFSYYLGIDGGGTKTDFCLADKDGRVIRQLTKGPCNPNAQGVVAAGDLLEAGALEICGNIPPEQVTVFAGIAGAGSHETFRQAVTVRLNSLGFSTTVGSDAQSVVAAGLRGRDGVVAILGTGSVVFAVENGVSRRIGGYGYLLGDDGSGYTLGRDALRAAMAAGDGSGDKTLIADLFRRETGRQALDCVAEIYQQGRPYIAGFSHLVMEAAQKGDRVALDILDRNMAALAAYIRAGLPAASNRPTKLVLAGGLITSSAGLLLPLLEKHIGRQDVQLRLMNQRVVYGALLLAGMPDTELEEE